MAGYSSKLLIRNSSGNAIFEVGSDYLGDGLLIINDKNGKYAITAGSVFENYGGGGYLNVFGLCCVDREGLSKKGSPKRIELTFTTVSGLQAAFFAE